MMCVVGRLEGYDGFFHFFFFFLFFEMWDASGSVALIWIRIIGWLIFNAER